MAKLSRTQKEFLYQLGSLVAREAKRRAPYKSGNLRRDIQVFTRGLNQGFVEVGNTKLAHYAIFVHQGTGLYGARKTRIKPKHKRALKTPLGIFKSIKGQRAQPYLQDAAKKVLKSKEAKSIIDAYTKSLSTELTKDFKSK